MRRLTLFGSLGCHLCEQAERLLDDHRPGPEPDLEIERVEITDHPELLARYQTRIPVLRDTGSGRELDWPFDAAQLADFLRGREE